METLPEQFKDALSRIELKGKRRDRAIAAHGEIRRYLEKDDRLRSWGVNTILIGSYARNTGIYPGKDVDVFSKLTKLDTTASPKTVYEAVRDVLIAKYGDRAVPQARSIKVLFGFDDDEFAVDAVPAVQMGNRWGIPRRDASRWGDPDPSARWVETDPEKLAELTITMNDALEVSGQGAYVPTVKLVRQTREHHIDDGEPGGLYFELLTYWVFKGGVKATSFSEIFAATLRSIASQLANPSPLMDPVLGLPYEPKPEHAERAAAAATLARLAAKAERAIGVARCPAAVLWREILGQNDRGPCFPLPPGCDEKGNEIKPLAAVAAVGSKEASGFARHRRA